METRWFVYHPGYDVTIEYDSEIEAIGVAVGNFGVVRNSNGETWTAWPLAA